MGMTERGVYITLLSHGWRDFGIPNDLGELADIVGMKHDQFARMWTRGQLHKCFELREGRLKNPRQERQRQALVAFRQRQQQNGAKGGRPPKIKNTPQSADLKPRETHRLAKKTQAKPVATSQSQSLSQSQVQEPPVAPLTGGRSSGRRRRNQDPMHQPGWTACGKDHPPRGRCVGGFLVDGQGAPVTNAGGARIKCPCTRRGPS